MIKNIISTVAAIVAVVSITIAIMGCAAGNEETTTASTWTESHYSEAKAATTVSFDETSQTEKWPIAKFQGQWLMTGDVSVKHQNDAGSSYRQTLKTFERCSDGALRVHSTCASIIEIRTDVTSEEEAYAETSAPTYQDGDEVSVVVLHVPDEAE